MASATSGDRNALGDAADKLVALADRKGVGPQRLIEVGDELLDVAGLLRREPRLRRALSDPARKGAERVELLRNLLAGKVGDETVDLVGALVAGRWSSPVQLLNATERLGVDALLTSADRADKLGDIEDELFRLGQVVDGDNMLAAALGDSTAGLDRRLELLRDLIADKVNPVSLRLARLALAGFGGRGFSASLGRLVELAAGKRDRSIAYVTTAVPLSDSEEQRLAARLSEMYGRQVSPKIDVDPRIIGGMRVKVGSDLYDGTVARRLAEARAALAQ
jgi:F-type H+-transporting ATPase subunit delta